MEHKTLIEVIDRLIMSGLDEVKALLLVARLLDEESEGFLAAVDDLPEMEYFN